MCLKLDKNNIFIGNTTKWSNVILIKIGDATYVEIEQLTLILCLAILYQNFLCDNKIPISEYAFENLDDYINDRTLSTYDNQRGKETIWKKSLQHYYTEPGYVSIGKLKRDLYMHRY